MIEKVFNFLYLKINVSKPVTLILIVLIIKIIYTLWFNSYTNSYILKDSYFANIGGDSNEYITSALNIKEIGFYFPDFKAPGYSFLIYVFLIFTDLSKALDLVVLFQVILSSISVYVLAKLSFLITKSNLSFFLVFIFYTLSSYVTEYDRIILADSLTVSFLIFSFYYLYLGMIKDNRYYFYSGIGFCITIYFRPLLIVVLAALLMISFVKIVRDKKIFFYEIKYLGRIFLPFVIILSLWGARNVHYHQKYEPLMRLSAYDEIYKKTYYYDLHKYVQSWSGDAVFWDNTAEITWFGCGTRFNSNDATNLPNYIYTTKYDYYDLVSLKNKMRSFDTTGAPKLKDEICSQLKDYTQSFKSENKVLYYLLPVKIAKKFLINGGGTTSLFNKKFTDLLFIEKIFKLIMMSFYFVFCSSGVILSLFYSLKFIFKKVYNVADIFHAQIAVYFILSILAICFVYRFGEYRYFVPIYPICIILLFSNKKVLNILSQFKNKIQVSNR